MKKEELELKLKEVYDFTVEYSQQNGFPPSVRDISSALSIKSTATVYDYLLRLKQKGMLEKSPLKKRAISISNKQCFKSVPLVGTIRAGLPIFAVENLDGYYPLPPNMNSGCDFALRVCGDSMINAGIYENDLILVKKQNYAENGDIVVALVDDSATVKKFFNRNGKIILHPENENYSDLIFDDVSIIGVVKGLSRLF